MSEIEKEEENEMFMDHWSHEHPLTLVLTRRGDDCYGCPRPFRSGDLGYGCKNKCGYPKLLHEECAEMGKKIRHHMHPQHILIQERNLYVRFCAICKKFILWLGYCCTSSGCEFSMHIGCAQDKGDVMNDDIVIHRSHPEHELRLLRKGSSFRCDACGTNKLGNSYLCITCEYWIHCRCASLADTIEREDHHHSLSLSFDIPPEYIRCNYKCEVCHQQFWRKYWIYHCHLCRYAVHIKCAFKKSSHATTSNNENGKEIIRFPVNDVAGKQIRAFVMKMKGGIMPPIPDIGDDVKYYTFDHHKHQLSLISSSNIVGEEEEEEEDNSDEEDNDYTYKSKLICDGCINPIIFKREKCYYMSCSSCKYYLHWECFHLPPQLPSLTPLHQQPDHHLLLQSAPKLDLTERRFRCSVCELPMNGLFYACTRCKFKADINCASLPKTIYHSAHPHHLLNLLNIGKDFVSRRRRCAASCYFFWGFNYWYVCGSCDEFMLHVGCAILPPSVRNRRWDKHLLPLTYDAYVNHPDEFYCDRCETQMNPKMWMYHCRPCDLSFHPICFSAASGYFRNIKFGQQYHIKTAHPHPLTFQLLTTKLRCDVSRHYSYNRRGFHCASCNFFICFDYCARKMDKHGDILPVD